MVFATNSVTGFKILHEIRSGWTRLVIVLHRGLRSNIFARKIFVEVVLNRKPVGMAKHVIANLGRKCEADFDVIVHRSGILREASMAGEMRVKLAHAAEAFDHMSAGGTDQMPFHLEQTNFRAVEEEVNRFTFSHALFSS